MSYEEFKTCVSRNYVLLAHVSTISLGLNGCGKRVGQTVKQEAKTQTQEQTVTALLKKADAQDAKAQFNLGKMYNNCDGVTMSAWANSISSHGNSDKISHSDAGEISQS